LIVGGRSSTWAATAKRTPMRAETEKTIAEIEQVISLLRRHL
jgi:hypothetical protein